MYHTAGRMGYRGGFGRGGRYGGGRQRSSRFTQHNQHAPIPPLVPSQQSDTQNECINGDNRSVSPQPIDINAPEDNQRFTDVSFAERNGLHKDKEGDLRYFAFGNVSIPPLEKHSDDVYDPHPSDYVDAATDWSTTTSDQVRHVEMKAKTFRAQPWCRLSNVKPQRHPMFP